MSNRAEYAFYYFFAILGLVGSLVSFFLLYRLGKVKSCFTMILLFLHCSLFCEELSLLPFIYKGSYGVCMFVEFFEFYFGWVYVFTIGLLVYCYRKSILGTLLDEQTLIMKYGGYLITMIPMVLMIPFYIWGTFEMPDDPFCIITFDHNNKFLLYYYYAIAWTVILYCIVVMSLLIWHAFQYERTMIPKLFSSIGYYIFITILCWIPRTLIRVFAITTNGEVDMESFFPIYICGIFYCCIFYKEKQILSRLEWSEGIVNDDQRGTFSWENIGDFKDSTLSSDIRPSDLDMIAITTTNNPVINSKLQMTHFDSESNISNA